MTVILLLLTCRQCNGGVIDDAMTWRPVHTRSVVIQVCHVNGDTRHCWYGLYCHPAGSDAQPEIRPSFTVEHHLGVQFPSGRVYLKSDVEICLRRFPEQVIPDR